MKSIATALILAILALPSVCSARSTGYHYHSYHFKCGACEHRSTKAKDAFKKVNPCPATGRSSGACPGYVIDHVMPLKRGGADAPYNMQWQTKAAAKAKDKWE